jgi:hypothetical protein
MAQGLKDGCTRRSFVGFPAFWMMRSLGKGFPHVGQVSSSRVANVLCDAVAALSAVGMKEYRNHETRGHMRFAGLTQPLCCLPAEQENEEPLSGP